LALKDRATFLTTPDEVDAFLKAHPDSAVFKAGACHKTNETYAHVQAHLEARVDIPLGIVRVIECRAASNHVAALTGIRHESPQFILFRSGRAVFDRDNWDITAQALTEGLQAHFAVAAR